MAKHVHGPNCACGRPASPLDVQFHLPDVVAAMNQRKQKGHVWSSEGSSFGALNRMRSDAEWFVRALVPVPIEGGVATFFYGVWIKVRNKAEFDRIGRAWDDPIKYAGLSFEGELANTLLCETVLGAQVVAEVKEPGSKPHVVTSGNPRLAELLASGWKQRDYDAVAAVLKELSP